MTHAEARQFCTFQADNANFVLLVGPVNAYEDHEVYLHRTIYPAGKRSALSSVALEARPFFNPFACGLNRERQVFRKQSNC